MAFTPTNTKVAVNGCLGVDLTSTPTDPEFELGQQVTTNDGGCAVYVQASGAITQYDAVGIDENYQAASLTKAIADDGHMIGFAQTAFADNDYGWVFTKGSDIGVRVAAGCLPDVALYTTGTAGVLDDESSVQTKVDGIVAVESGSATSVEIIATWPKSTTF